MLELGWLAELLVGITPAQFGLLVLLGGAVALDHTALGQLLLARPLSGSILTGWLLGDPSAGLFVGFFLEALMLPSLPAGGARVPDGGPASVIGTTALVLGSGSGGIATALLVAMVFATSGAYLIEGVRALNGHWVARGNARLGRLNAARLQFTLLGVEFLRGALWTALGLILVTSLFRLNIPPTWPLSAPATALIALAFPLLWSGVLYRGWRKGLGSWATLAIGLSGGLLLGWWL